MTENPPLMTTAEYEAAIEAELNHPDTTQAERDSFRAGIAGGMAYAMSLVNKRQDIPIAGQLAISSALLQALVKWAPKDDAA